MRARVSESTVNALARRTSRLTEMIERATQVSPLKHVREGGAQLVELLAERLDELRDLLAIEDDELSDRTRSFELRLRMAEAKVLAWPALKIRRAAKVVEPKRRKSAA